MLVRGDMRKENQASAGLDDTRNHADRLTGGSSPVQTGPQEFHQEKCQPDERRRPMMMAMCFAKILRGEMPAERLYEDDHTLAIMDIMPRVETGTAW
jgi:hypothetical protein